ncbi:biotin--[acetyl-CoA-carboxylase] ligase [Thermincola ferriacetica]|nr:biotin--[acetyl-CoA-carboxylase] ligase [Thermincola ferriacetica]
MKDEILNLLKKSERSFLSGEEISSRLQVSRTAVWKHIQALREDGYTIESRSKVGYRLVTVPDRLYPGEITAGLKTRVIGSRIVHFDTIGSTNDKGKELAANGAPEGLVIVAEEQTTGRGRLGRTWSSPKGRGIWMSVILRPEINPMDAPKLTLLTAVALARTFDSYPGIQPGIKWPNDVFIKGKKIAGVLTEMNAELERINYVVVGIGVNVNTSRAELPPEIENIATSLYIETGKSWSRKDFLTKLLEELEALYLSFKMGEYAAVVEEWKKYSVTLNKKIKVTSPGVALEGTAVDLDDDGALIVRTRDGSLKRVVAGEITFASR